jgi:hypothetical protein
LRRYFKSSFFIDFISTIPYDVIINSLVSIDEKNKSGAFMIPRLLKTLRLARLTKLLRILKVSVNDAILVVPLKVFPLLKHHSTITETWEY